MINVEVFIYNQRANFIYYRAKMVHNEPNDDFIIELISLIKVSD